MKRYRHTSLTLRGHRASLLEWGAADGEIIILLHGWMDGAASFQFIADRLDARWRLIAPDQRGYGDTEWTREPAGGYWFPEYVADLDALIDHVSPEQPVHLVGHSLGGNIACLYAGIRPERVRTLASLDGFGLPESDPAKAAERYRRWLDASKAGAALRPYPTLAAVADRLQQSNPRLPRDRAEWIAAHWAQGDDVTGWRLKADPAHKLPFPTGYRLDEALAIWREVTAPTLWIGAALSDATRWLGYDGTTRVPQAGEPVAPGTFAARLAAFRQINFIVLDDVGHMLHHEAPERVAPLLEAHWLSV
ncbi:MAG: alpha/beta fold hydrolase [Casimicrobiaceae bacterium]